MTSEAESLEVLASSVTEDRARLEEAAKEIQRKLTPGQLIDEIIRQGGEPARGALAGLGKTVSAHPIPTLLMGAALIWLALEGRPEPQKTPAGAPPVL